ncbi:ectonucleotide pyrophosphatase/phosphodiesterase family member 1 [Chanos chanos]|uniref:Ectonucleotide pyrophosphatase/phosphodiesterase family member 1 n=1 Tax=Chanos chanos TaxID=29144 RepID=A0A6J2W011_CHACN|nr:ectonucleotide pyrophosphatase/phosphodiesterase family member 1-like [Chanos chanos]
MEAAKGDEQTAERVAALLGSGQQEKRADGGNSRKSNKNLIIGGVLLLCLTAIVLGLAFALRQRCDAAAMSCRGKCVSGRDSGAPCHCDAACVNEGSCCLDYKEVCVEASQRWSCSKFRCGEERLNQSLCSCSEDCLTVGDCCTDYLPTCQGGTRWQEDGCEELEGPQCPEGFSRPPVILVSLDGFRAGYLKAYGSLLPVLSKLRKCGTSTPYMRPAYPTKTFPNHYTIVTGLYPESHGIIDNKMYDVTRNATFSLKVAEKFNPDWYQGEPVWLTAMQNNLRTGTFFWPGSDVPIQGKYPHFFKMYDRSIVFEKRVATVLQWMSLPRRQRPDFYTLYLEEPDSSGHQYGPMSSQVIAALMNVDRILGLLMDGLKERNLHKCVNLVVVSDHGMEEASCKKAAYVSSYQDNIGDFTVIQGPAARIRPKRLPEEFFTFDYEGLVKNLSCRAADQPMRPYLKEHLPKRLHFANNVRIERAHLYMKEQWQAALQPKEIKYCLGGFHGSDNVFKNMQSIFIGHGPGMKFKTSVAPFESIEVYNLLCDLMGIAPAPNNGTHGSLNHLLRNPPYTPVYPAELSPASTCIARGPAPTDPLGCSCPSLSEDEVKTLNQRIVNSNLDSELKTRHLPYGIPRVLQEKADYCFLPHADYVSAYSKDLHMPLWVAYSIRPLTVVQALNFETEACVRADVRVQPSVSQHCSTYRQHPRLTYSFLHMPNLAPQDTRPDSLLTSNMVPVFPVFKGIWDYFHTVLLVKYSRKLNGVNVMSGPIFDKNYDGTYDMMTTTTLSEVPVPTHFFVILTSCRNSSFTPERCEGPLEATAFVLPHRDDSTETCTNGTDHSWVEEWAQFHVARVRDIELLTGLSFYHDRISVTETLQLKTFLQTF